MALAGTGRASIDEKPALAGAGPMAGGTDRPAANPADPLMMRAGGTPYAHLPQPDHIYRIAIQFRQIAARHHRPGNRPITAGSMGTYAEFVIAVAALGYCRYSALACLPCSIGSNVAKYSIRSR